MRQSGPEVSWACLLLAFVSCTAVTCLNKGRVTMISAAGKDLKQNLLFPNEISELAESSWCTRLHPRGWEGVKNCKTDAPAGKKTSKRKPKYVQTRRPKSRAQRGAVSRPVAAAGWEQKHEPPGFSGEPEMITAQCPPSRPLRSSAVTFPPPPLLTTQNCESHRLASVPTPPRTASPSLLRAPLHSSLPLSVSSVLISGHPEAEVFTLCVQEGAWAPRM